MVYEWQFGKFKASAEDAGRIFEKIERRDGAVTPEAVLEDARSEDSPIHGDFEWDNDKAAEKYRLKQAQQMISLLVVSEDDKPNTRAFVNTHTDIKKAAYMNVGKAMQSQDLRRVVLGNARREMIMFNSKYAKYMELAKVTNAIDEFLKEDDHNGEV